MDLTDCVLDHLRRVANLPDLTGTRYSLESEIGRGGLGVVYAAWDQQLNRRVALKVVESSAASEARLIAQLEHPGIVPIYDAGILEDGRSFYAMKLIGGARLDRFLQLSHSLGERLLLIRRIGEALAFAHARGILHRDLKPHNVMVGEFGEVYVMDWGVETVTGTPGFRAPEGIVDDRSDLYSLGAILQFALPAKAPAALRAVAAKATSTAPGARYPSVLAMLQDLDRFQDGCAVSAWSEPLWHRLSRFASRNAILLWLLGAYAAVKFSLFFLRTL